jgi:hypothetical protein
MIGFGDHERGLPPPVGIYRTLLPGSTILRTQAPSRSAQGIVELEIGRSPARFERRADRWHSVLDEPVCRRIDAFGGARVPLHALQWEIVVRAAMGDERQVAWRWRKIDGPRLIGPPCGDKEDQGDGEASEPAANPP